MSSRPTRRRGNVVSASDPSAEETEDVDAVIARNLWKHHRMLPPDSKFKHNWDNMMLLFVLYTCTMVPLQLAFDDGEGFTYHDAHAVLDYLIDALFIVDIVINFRTTHYDDEHQIVLDARVVAKRYARGYFPLDLIASFPYELFFLATGESMEIDIFGVFKMPRLLRLPRAFRRLEQMSSAAIFRVMRLMGAFMMFAHWVACIWWMIGKAAYEVDDPHGTSWLRRLPYGSTALDTNTTVSPFDQQYLSSLYWSLTTLMKTPWVGPDTVAEKVYASFCVVFGAVLFATLLANVTAMVSSYDKYQAELRDRMTTLRNFSAFRRVPSALQRRMCAPPPAELSRVKPLSRPLARPPPVPVARPLKEASSASPPSEGRVIWSEPTRRTLTSVQSWPGTRRHSFWRQTCGRSLRRNAFVHSTEHERSSGQSATSGRWIASSTAPRRSAGSEWRIAVMSMPAVMLQYAST